MKNNKKLFRIILPILVVVAIFVSFYVYQSNKTPGTLLSCKLFEPDNYVFPSDYSLDRCIENEECHLYSELLMNHHQEKALMYLGNKVKSQEDLKFDEGYDIYSATNTTKMFKSDSDLEILTHGDSRIPFKEVEITEKEYEDFKMNLSGSNSFQFLRKTFNDYVAEKPINILNEKVTKNCHIVYDEIIGLEGFDKSYYKSRFVPLAIYKHVWGGYDIFFIFIDKPDVLFRAWVGFDKEDKYQLKIIKDSGVPKDEVEIIYNAYKKAWKDPRISI